MSTLLNQPKPENVTFSHSWTITDFSQKLSSSVEHPCFNSCTFPSTSSITKSANQFRLNLYPKGINENFCDYLSIGLGAVSVIEEGEKITVRYRVSLINSKGNCRNTKEWIYIFSSSKRVSVYGRFIKRRDLLDTSNGLLLDDKLVLHCEGTVLGNLSALNYANINLSDLKFISKSQPDLMVEMLYNLATKHRRTYYSPNGIPNFEIQNQVEETFSYSYKAKIYKGQYFTWSQSTYMKNTEELKSLSHQEMLNLLSFWMVSGKHSDLSLVLQGDLEKVLNVHKIILLNRSSSFDALLQQNSRLFIGDVPFEVFDQLIHYLYSGKVPLLKKYQYELLNVSNEYGFNILNQMSQLSICDEISHESVIHTLIYANSASADQLKRACLEYITDHATKLMFELDLLKPELIEELYRNLSLKKRLAESDHAYDQKVTPNFEIQNQVDETFSYTHIALYDKLSYSAWSNFKYNTRSTQELMQHSRDLMLDTLYYWMNSGDYGDLLLVVGEQEELLSLHSIVLLNRSSAFDALMHNNTIVTEEQTKRVSIADPIEVFDQLIQYLYTGEVPLLKKCQYELLNVACEYDFDVLKQMCELSICDEITNENVINVLILANQVSVDRLKQTAFDFIIDHATEIVFDHLDSLEPELIEEMYRNLALKKVLYESEDRKVYENFPRSFVSNGIEESLSYTHLKMYHIFNEFTFQDVSELGCLNTFEGPEFCAAETPIFKFKLQHVPYKKNRHFFLLVNDLRRYGSFKARESYFCYKMSLCLCLGNESYETLGACDGFKYFQLYSGGTRVLNKLSLQNRDKLDYHYPNRNHALFLAAFSRLRSTFKIRSDITVLCDILAMDLSPIRGLSQLELEQSRQNLFECMNSLLLKSEDDKRDVTLDICGAELKAHKLFLTQSSVLEAMIFRQSKQIHISDLSIETLEKFMQYLYTGTVQSLNMYNARGLLIVANKFKLEILMQMCQLVLNLLPAQWSANGTYRFKLKLG